jgi:integral membrane protein
VTETPTSDPTPTDDVAPQDERWTRRARGALGRYRVMAWITGTMLLLLCLEIVLKYVLQVNGVDEDGSPKPVIGTWVAFAHGWIYVVYLVTVVDLWSTMRWRLGRLAALAAAGVVPVMSFVLERRVHRQTLAAIEGADAR